MRHGNERDLLNRFLDGSMEPAERDLVSARLQNEPALRAQLERIRSIRQIVGQARVDSFAPFFSDRVMRRLSPARVASAADSLYEGLRFVFARTAVAGLAVAVVLAAFNMMAYGDLDFASSVTEVLFGLPSASLVDALTYSGY